MACIIFIWSLFRMYCDTATEKPSAKAQNRKNRKQKEKKEQKMFAAGTERLVKVRGGKGKNFASFCVENKYLKLRILF